MTERDELQRAMVVKLREHADFLKHNVATWQLLARAADEIERLRNDFSALQTALVGDSGLSAIGEAARLRKLHPLDSGT